MHAWIQTSTWTHTDRTCIMRMRMRTRMRGTRYRMQMQWTVLNGLFLEQTRVKLLRAGIWNWGLVMKTEKPFSGFAWTIWFVSIRSMYSWLLPRYLEERKRQSHKRRELKRQILVPRESRSRILCWGFWPFTRDPQARLTIHMALAEVVTEGSKQTFSSSNHYPSFTLFQSFLIPQHILLLYLYE